jgi:hypothetical protein
MPFVEREAKSPVNFTDGGGEAKIEIKGEQSAEQDHQHGERDKPASDGLPGHGQFSLAGGVADIDDDALR